MEVDILINRARRKIALKKKEEQKQLIEGEIGKVDTKVSEVAQEVNHALEVATEALEVAKKTGKQKGEKGDDGKSIKGDDGYTPIKGKDYFDGKDGKDGKDGYTPVKGRDYFDGKPGKNGKDGKSIKGEPGKDGKDGSPDTPYEIRDKLSSLKGRERLDAKAIKNLGKEVGLVVSGITSKQEAGLTDHSLLTNLDYANSGHTGFEQEGAGQEAVNTHESTYSHDLSVYVPYTGATADVDLGAYNIRMEDNKGLISGTNGDMSIYYDGTSGNIKTNLVVPVDLHIECGTDKTVVLDTPVWDDIQFGISSGKVSAVNFPDWDTFTTNTSAYKFTVNDFIDLGANEMAHWWKEGTTVYPHLHIALNGANTSGSSQYVKFTIYFAYADSNEVWTETSFDLEKEIANGTADLTNLLANGASVALTNNLIGTQVKVRVKRVAATSGTEYPNHIFVTQFGIHALKDTMGSRTITVK